MNWILWAIIAYFVIASETILDKFLLTSKRISHPVNYAFYSGLMSLFAFVLFPFGFHIIPGGKILFSLVSGMLFTGGILSLFFAIQKNEASRVIPLVGAVIPIVVYLLSKAFLKEHLGNTELLGVVALVSGGLWLSFNMEEKTEKKFFDGFYVTILAGVLLAIVSFSFKKMYLQDNFINVYIWTRFGVMLGALSLFLVPHWRKRIFASFSNFKKPSVRNQSSGLIFIATKILGGTGSILKEWSTALGSVVIVNSLVSVEYIFIFVLGIILSFRFPKIFQEKKNVENAMQKITAIALITIGIVLVSGL